jgi:hypothetical protein
MSEGTEQHLEHAEHAQHHAHNPFDRRVAMTMSIMAALLAGVTLVSHRGHTETLRLTTEATTNHTKASDDWNLYQAKNIRSHEYQAFLFLQSMLAKDALKHDEASTAMRDFWINQVDKYEGPGYWASFLEGLTKQHAKADAKATTEAAAAKSGELAELKTKAEELQAHARGLEEKSHALHGTVTWIDLGHLGLELALVFCAVAVLTKQRTFWLTGIGFAVVGFAVASYGMVGWWLLEQTATHH